MKLIDANDVANTLLTNSAAETEWTIGNGWIRTTEARATAVPQSTVTTQFDADRVSSPAPDFVPHEAVGAGYVSLGYRRT